MYYINLKVDHSTETALTLMTERWMKALNDGNIVGTIMVDFRKDFDLFAAKEIKRL